LLVFLALQADLTQKASETEAYKARTNELEQILAKKDLAMTDQKRLLKKVKVRKRSLKPMMFSGLNGLVE
jgi:hypothetical protein